MQRSARICGRTDKLVVDHDHASSKFRGIVCQGCNILLGHSKDNLQDKIQRLTVYVKYFQRAAKYLEGKTGRPVRIDNPVEFQWSGTSRKRVRSE